MQSYTNSDEYRKKLSEKVLKTYYLSVYVYPTILVGLVTTWDEFFLVVLDADNVFPATRKGKGTYRFVENENVEMPIHRHCAI